MTQPSGRWPPDVVITHHPECVPGQCVDWCVAVDLDRQSGNIPASGRRIQRSGHSGGIYGPSRREGEERGFRDSGGCSRFFPQFWHHTNPPTTTRRSTVQLIHGDCLDVLRTLPDRSVDAVVTDPPAGISFMGKAWDGDKGGRDQWIAWLAERLAECLRVLKPGGHAVVWALPRTSGWTHRALEDAGFDVRDCVHHLHGSGFPKSLSVPKATQQRLNSLYGDAQCRCLDAGDGRPAGHSAGQGGRSTPGDQRAVGHVPAEAARRGHLPLDEGAGVGAMCELRRDDEAQAEGPATVGAALLLEAVRGCGPEAPGLRHAPIRGGVEEPPSRDQAARQDVPGVREDSEGEWLSASCPPSAPVPLRGDEPAGEPGGALRPVPSHDRSNHGPDAGVDPDRRDARRLVLDGDGRGRDAVAWVCSWCGLPDGDWLTSLEGLGTALKPAVEHWWLARKPLDSTVAGTVTRWGTGALNIDATRVTPTGEKIHKPGPNGSHVSGSYHPRPWQDDAGMVDARRERAAATIVQAETMGRWPADVVLSHSAECNGVCSPGCAVAELDQQSGTLKSGDHSAIHQRVDRADWRFSEGASYGDSGGASRFFKTFHADPGDEFFPIESKSCGDGSTRVESTSAGRTTGSRSDSLPTAGSGSKPTDRSLPDTRSTTSTTTRSTTTSATLPASPQSGTTTTTNASARSTDGSTESSTDTAHDAISGSSSPTSTSAEPEPGAATASHAPSPNDANGSPTTANGSTPSAGTGTPAACLPDRFFPTFKYQAKPSTREKSAGLDARNHHPTTKPAELMRWLCRLVTPPGGVILDPFAGSGTTGVAAVLEGLDVILVEAEAEYMPLIEGRVRWAEQQAEQPALSFD